MTTLSEEVHLKISDEVNDLFNSYGERLRDWPTHALSRLEELIKATRIMKEKQIIENKQ